MVEWQPSAPGGHSRAVVPFFLTSAALVAFQLKGQYGILIVVWYKITKNKSCFILGLSVTSRAFFLSLLFVTLRLSCLRVSARDVPTPPTYLDSCRTWIQCQASAHNNNELCNFTSRSIDFGSCTTTKYKSLIISRATSKPTCSII